MYRAWAICLLSARLVQQSNAVLSRASVQPCGTAVGLYIDMTTRAILAGSEEAEKSRALVSVFVQKSDKKKERRVQFKQIRTASGSGPPRESHQCRYIPIHAYDIW